MDILMCKSRFLLAYNEFNGCVERNCESCIPVSFFDPSSSQNAWKQAFSACCYKQKEIIASAMI